MFKLYDRKQPSSGSQQSERVYRLEKELKVARKQEVYQAVVNQMVSLATPFSMFVATTPFLDNSASKKVDSLERELIKEKTLSGCSSKETPTKSILANYFS